MKKMTELNITGQHEFFDTIFSGVHLAGADITEQQFENCEFINCNFSETTFTQCKFIDCDFKSCNLCSVQFEKTSMNAVVFHESKILGVNWTKLRWPYVRLSSPLHFYKSNISDSNFFELDLKEVIIEECKAHSLDFRGANLTSASFVLSDLSGSQFMHTKLDSADFTEAINYNINPNDNSIRKAKFSLPDAMNLLNAFEVEIQ